MGRFVRGDIVVVPFPFSTGLQAKRRPALVIAEVPYGNEFDCILCAMSATHDGQDPNLLNVVPGDVVPGSEYNPPGYIRPTTLFTMDGRQIVRSIGKLTDEKIADVMSILTPLFS